MSTRNWVMYSFVNIQMVSEPKVTQANIPKLQNLR